MKSALNGIFAGQICSSFKSAGLPPRSWRVESGLQPFDAAAFDGHHIKAARRRRGVAPQKVARTELQWEGESAVRETLFYPEHQAVYTAGRLTGVTLEEGSTLALADRRLGQAASSLAALGEANSKEGGEWTFAVTPADLFVFKIRQNKIAGAQYRFEPEDQQ